MVDVYEVTNFNLDYCQADISKIATAIKSKASLLAIGMPGCGKSRLIDFLLHRPGVKEQGGLPGNLTFIRVDGDMVATGAQGMYLELLRALNSGAHPLGDGSHDALKNQLVAEVGKLAEAVDLVLIFDNFTRSLQQALGESFFNFLFALRNSRPKLNITYLFLANLNIDFSGFYKLARLFDQGPDRSVCWISLLNRKDTFFSIERQLHRAGQPLATFDEAAKERIFALAGGHALLTRYLTHLALSGEAALTTAPDQLLGHGGIRAACEAIWNDLAQSHRNYLIELAMGRANPPDLGQPGEILQKYGVLKDQNRFFSLLFESYVKTRPRLRMVVDVSCAETQAHLIVKTAEAELSFAIHELSRRKRKLLCYLVENQGEPCSKDRLIKAGWPSDDEEGVTDRALARQIDELRRWLRQPGQVGQYLEIKNVWGEGYQLVVKD